MAKSMNVFQIDANLKKILMISTIDSFNTHLVGVSNFGVSVTLLYVILLGCHKSQLTETLLHHNFDLYVKEI